MHDYEKGGGLSMKERKVASADKARLIRWKECEHMIASGFAKGM